MTALLASVRTVEEAIHAVGAGADVIDLKEPRTGALGALPLPLIRAIAVAVRSISPAPVSATIGDLADGALEEMTRRVVATAASGVDFVKVGIARGTNARAALDRLAGLPAPVVPLFFADGGIDLALVEHAAASGFPVVMVDTADKHAGCLFDCVTLATLRQLIATVHGAGARAGLAGSLRAEHLPLLNELAPAIAGFRGALCDGGRTGQLVPTKVRALRAALAALCDTDLAQAVGRMS